MATFAISTQTGAILGSSAQSADPSDCTFYIRVSALTYYSYNCLTNTLAYTGTQFSIVLENTISAMNSGGKIFIENGMFVIGSPIVSSANNIVLEGEGSATNLTLAPSFNHSPLTISGSNWLITEVRMDARNLGALAIGLGIPTILISGYNDTISYSYFTNGDHGQIDLHGTNDKALYNQVTNSHDDGIIVRGHGNAAIGNYVYKTTNHNCISVVTASYALIEENSCIDSGGEGIALENTGGGPDNGVIVSGNTIVSPARTGIKIYPMTAGLEAANNVTISGNAIFEPGMSGIYVHGSGQQVNAEDNTMAEPGDNGIPAQTLGKPINSLNITGNTISDPVYDGIYIANPAPNLVVEGNTVHNIGAIKRGVYGIYLIGASDCSVSGNLVTTAATSTYDGGLATATNATAGCVISGNTFKGVAGHGVGIYFAVATTDTIVSDNVLGNFSIGIKESASSDYNTITGNDLRTIVTTPLKLVGIHDTVNNNTEFGTALSCNRASVVVGSVIACEATVHESGTNAPTGSVTWSSSIPGKFSSTSCTLSRHNTHSRCSVRFTPTAAGSVLLTANYGGDFNNPVATTEYNLVVTLKTSTTAVSCTPRSAVAGSPTIITCKARVIGYRPTGTVSWSQSGTGSVSLSSTTCILANLKNYHQAACSVTMTGTTAGTVTLQAAYGADPNNLGSHRTARLTIKP